MSNSTKDAIYTVEQLDTIIELITKRFIESPDAYEVHCRYDRIDVTRADQLGTMIMTIPSGYPEYVQLYIGEAHSWTVLSGEWIPFMNHKVRKKVQRLAKMMRDKDALLEETKRRAKLNEKINNANEAFMKAFPEITDLLLENQDGKEN